MKITKKMIGALLCIGLSSLGGAVRAAQLSDMPASAMPLAERSVVTINGTQYQYQKTVDRSKHGTCTIALRALDGKKIGKIIFSLTRGHVYNISVNLSSQGQGVAKWLGEQVLAYYNSIGITLIGWNPVPLDARTPAELSELYKTFGAYEGRDGLLYDIRKNGVTLQKTKTAKKTKKGSPLLSPDLLYSRLKALSRL